MSNSTESPHYPRLSDDSNVQINIVLKLQNYKKQKNILTQKCIKDYKFLGLQESQNCWLLARR